ncbi:MAG: MCE family protein [Deltaproteobacteria bacterium]|nr:MCE family protein [Deltaproteobacteria bacterium]
MLKLSAEAKVGIFVFIGLILLVYMSLRVGGIKFGREEGYTLTVRLDNASGLDTNASVRVAGVEVGRVRKILLEDNKAKLVLRIRPEVKIGKDFTAVLRTSGMLGERYLELIPGSPNAPSLEEGGDITRVATYADMEKLINLLADVASDVKNVTASFSSVLGGNEGEATLKNIVKNLEEVTENVNAIIKENDKRFSTVMVNFEDFSASIKDASRNLNSLIVENKDNLKGGVENLKNASLKLEEAMDTLNKIAPKVEDTISSVDSIAKKIDRGEGTLGKLINDPTTHEILNKTLSGINNYIDRTERFRTFVSYRGEFLFDEQDTKNYLSLKVQPKADKYYLFEVVDDPRGRRKTETVTIGGATTSVTKTSQEFKLSLELAKRFEDLAIRGGVIESSGGFGIDYYMLKDRVKIAFEAFDFDFNKKRNPHLKIGTLVRLNKYFFVTAGYDDFISKDGFESAYLGVGFEFEDEDLKYLFTSAPSIKP